MTTRSPFVFSPYLDRSYLGGPRTPPRLGTVGVGDGRALRRGEIEAPPLPDPEHTVVTICRSTCSGAVDCFSFVGVYDNCAVCGSIMNMPIEVCCGWRSHGTGGWRGEALLTRQLHGNL
ncbi:hypothetical protein GWI33_008543 [Rhynchophorus ferrugineus]|uniref:Uncharacterized protein n=1 Tax=Rhynchophorus ferrugineus TaxID=354439 RepID=A0A834IBU3_RHYFE|nr:hypothetical protein GWI33_008543 [Rhynchophorus ferrugineus]